MADLILMDDGNAFREGCAEFLRTDAGTNKGRWILDSTKWVLRPPLASENDPGVKLSAQDYIVMRTLVEGCGSPISRRQLVGALGRDYLEYDQRRMDTQMRRLRRKVSSQCGIELPVKTIHSLGYIFVADAELR